MTFFSFFKVRKARRNEPQSRHLLRKITLKEDVYRLYLLDLCIIQAVKLVIHDQTERKDGGLKVLGHENDCVFVQFS